MKLKKTILMILAVAAIIFIAACSGKTTTQVKKDSPYPEMTVYKSPTCGCCVGYASYAEQQNFNVNTIMVDDMQSIKDKHNIPKDMESCHTVEIGGYFVEGHVPIEAIQKLLAEKPEIDGIALPRMPSGSPGMPGAKTGTWTIYGIKDGNYNVFMEI